MSATDWTSGYQRALEAAGATVHAYEEFGSYQGDWWARVTIGDRSGWIHDYFGSCSGCDAFEADFAWGEETPEALAAFGSRYLDDIITQEAAETEAAKFADWDTTADEVVAFIKANAEVSK